MDKRILLLFVSLTIIVSACMGDGNEEQSTQKENVNNENTAIEENNSENQNNESNTKDDVENESKENDKEEKLNDFVEYDTLQEEIDVDSLQAEIKTDNPNKRIILYSNEGGDKVNKSIFIKNKNRLKIIDLNDDDQIYNQIIE